jgi:hypothetical protein
MSAPEQPARIDGSRLVVDQCRFCGGTHYHGAADVDAIGDTAHRGAHCHAADVSGYVLVVEEAEA